MEKTKAIIALARNPITGEVKLIAAGTSEMETANAVAVRQMFDAGLERDVQIALALADVTYEMPAVKGAAH